MRGLKRDIVTDVREAVLPDAALREVQKFLADRFRGRSVRIYEAGGGSLSILPSSSLNNPKISVVDIDETQLRNNSYADTEIIGDIQTYVFPPDSFDRRTCDSRVCRGYPKGWPRTPQSTVHLLQLLPGSPSHV
jgi:hypothetical protein